MRNLRGCLGWLGLFWSCICAASGREDLQNFLLHTHQGVMDFVQTSEAGQVSSGRFVFSRPSLFRWTYEKPYQQILVGDGQYLWIWDPDLNQAIRKPISQGLGGTPAALLSGKNDLETGFDLSEGKTTDQMSWVIAIPKNPDSGFQEVRLGFLNHQLHRMNFKDTFNHWMTIDFTLLSNSGVDSADFHFAPPKGADVIQ
jgi:outer membrane lipoprotein carrier protein